MSTNSERKERTGVALLAAIVGLAGALISGMLLVPRVRVVEVLTVIASAVGSGAAFALAVNEVVKGRSRSRSAAPSDTPVRPVDARDSATHESAPDRE